MLRAHSLQFCINGDVAHNVKELLFTSVVVLALDTPQVFLSFICMVTFNFLTSQLRLLEIPHIGNLGLACARDEITGNICIRLCALHHGISSALRHTRLFQC